jgi:hypothetical protein
MRTFWKWLLLMPLIVALVSFVVLLVWFFYIWAAK